MKHTFTLMFCAVFMICTKAQETTYHYNSFREPHDSMMNRLDYLPPAVDPGTFLPGDGKWSTDFAVSGITGNVYTTATDGTNLYVGGNFTVAGSTMANSVAMWDGTQWHSLGTGLQNGVRGDIPAVSAMAFLDGKLFVGGQFSKAGDMPVNGIAYWDGEHWNRMGNDSVNGVRRKVLLGEDTLVLTGFVNELMAHNGKIYVAGDFQYAGKCRTNAIAIWDPATSSWESPGNGIPENDENPYVQVFCIAAHDSMFYAGGTFTTEVNGTPVKNIIAWNGMEWKSLGEAHAYVMDMVTDGYGNLYAAGIFSPDSVEGASSIGLWNGTAWTSLEAPDDYKPFITRLSMYKNELYAGGTFSMEYETPDKNLARWNGTQWQIVEGLAQTRYSFHQAGISTMEAVGDNLFIGGNFMRAGDFYTMNIAGLDPENLTWKSLDDGKLNRGIHDGRIITLAQSGDTLYAGGDFTVAGGVYARGIAMWTGNEWKSLGTGTEEYNGIRGTVYTLLADGKDVYAGGYFDQAGGEAAFHIARWDGTKWWPMGIGVGGVSGAQVRAIAKKGNYVYVAGYFGVVGDAENYDLPANSIARFDMETDRWETLGRGIELTQGVPGKVYDLEWHGDTLMVGGEFYDADGMFTKNMAALVNDKWVTPGTHPGFGIEGMVKKIKSVGDDLYIGGLLKTEQDGESHGILKWHSGSWEDPGERLNANDEDVWVNDIAEFDSGIVAGGLFSLAGGLQVNNLAYFDGNTWKAVNGGVLPGVSCMAASKYDLYVAGPPQILTNAGLNMGIARLSYEPPVIVGNEGPGRSFITMSIYPNPSGDVAHVTFRVPVTGNVAIHLFDSQGKQVMTLLNDRRAAGEYTVGLNTSVLPQGLYFCRMISGGHVETVKVLVR